MALLQRLDQNHQQFVSRREIFARVDNRSIAGADVLPYKLGGEYGYGNMSTLR